MNILDIIILICFIPALISGLKKGIIGQVTGLLSIILGCQFAMLLQQPFTKWLTGITGADPGAIKIASFVIIFIIAAILLALLGKIIEKVVKVILLGWLNRLLGVIVAFILAMLIIGIIGILVTSLNNILELFDPTILEESVLLTAFQKLTTFIIPVIKKLIF